MKIYVMMDFLDFFTWERICKLKLLPLYFSVSGTFLDYLPFFTIDPYSKSFSFSFKEIIVLHIFNAISIKLSKVCIYVSWCCMN